MLSHNHTCLQNYACNATSMVKSTHIPLYNILQYGAEEKDVVYPGERGVSVELDPGNIVCSDVTTEDTSCTAIITRDDVYTVSLTLRNDVDSTQAVVDMFDCELKYNVHVNYVYTVEPL